MNSVATTIAPSGHRVDAVGKEIENRGPFERPEQVDRHGPLQPQRLFGLDATLFVFDCRKGVRNVRAERFEERFNRRVERLPVGRIQGERANHVPFTPQRESRRREKPPADGGLRRKTRSQVRGEIVAHDGAVFVDAPGRGICTRQAVGIEIDLVKVGRLRSAPRRGDQPAGGVRSRNPYERVVTCFGQDAADVACERLLVVRPDYGLVDAAERNPKPFGPAPVGDVHDEHQDLAGIARQHRARQKDPHARAVAAEVLLFVGVRNAAFAHLGERALVGVQPLGTRKNPPVQLPRLEILPAAPDNREVVVVCLYDLAAGARYGDADATDGLRQERLETTVGESPLFLDGS